MADTWNTLHTEELDIGKNNFLEISLKQPPEGEKEYIQISKGWKTETGEKRYKSNIMFDVEKSDKVIELIKKLK